jgi:cysteinyl-tRNA synthetase
MSLPVIQLTDTLRGRKVVLETLQPGKVGIYCCGPTVYDMSHIGHARAALAPDVIVRTLRFLGYEVTYVRNITDIDDKIIARAQEQGIPAAEIAARFTAEYHRDLTALGMLEPDVEPRVSEHLPEIVELVRRLIDRGFAYPVEGGDVYYRVGAFAPYGALSKRNAQEMLDGAVSRVETDPRKESPLDFALWKAAKPGEPFWQSPWGSGRPGWHIECSAMSSAHLGASFDLHTGGRDLIFPHHENEIAQSQGAHGDGTFASYWLHNGFINFAGEKMSKSLGNFFTIRDILERHVPEALRYFLLTVQYRTGLNFEVEVLCPACRAAVARADQDAGLCSACGRQGAPDVRFPGLEDADDRVTYVYTTILAAQQALAGGGASDAEPDGPVLESLGGVLDAFREAMANDFNTPAALAVLSKPLTDVNGLLASAKGIDKQLRRRSLARFLADVATIGGVLGLFHGDPAPWLTHRRDLKARRLGLDLAQVATLLEARTAARTARDWGQADRCRDELAALGVSVQDGPAGTTWTV